MSSKRSAPRSAVASPSTPAPVATALLLSAAVSYALWLLVQLGRVSWPPQQLLASIYTLAGCLAMVGPLVLTRREPAEGGLGELLWMTGGMLVWIFDAVGAIRGDYRMVAWATPIGSQTMGLTILAVLLAGWRCRLGGRNWSWTNVVGWSLGLFWVGMAFSTWLTDRAVGTIGR